MDAGHPEHSPFDSSTDLGAGVPGGRARPPQEGGGVDSPPQEESPMACIGLPPQEGGGVMAHSCAQRTTVVSQTECFQSRFEKSISEQIRRLMIYKGNSQR